MNWAILLSVSTEKEDGRKTRQVQVIPLPFSLSYLKYWISTNESSESTPRSRVHRLGKERLLRYHVNSWKLGHFYATSSLSPSPSLYLISSDEEIYRWNDVLKINDRLLRLHWLCFFLQERRLVVTFVLQGGRDHWLKAAAAIEREREKEGSSLLIICHNLIVLWNSDSHGRFFCQQWCFFAPFMKYSSTRQHLRHLHDDDGNHLYRTKNDAFSLL